MTKPRKIITSDHFYREKGIDGKWGAWYEPPPIIIGSGKTEEAAINDLLEKHERQKP